MKSEDDLRSMTVAQLRQYANDEGIDLGGASAKEDIILAIMLAEGEAEATQPIAEQQPAKPEEDERRESRAEGEEAEGESGELMGQPELAATIGGTAPIEPEQQFTTGPDPEELVGEPTAELMREGIIEDPARTDEAPLVSVGEPDWDLMPASVREVLEARDMPITTEGLQRQETVESPAAYAAIQSAQEEEAQVEPEPRTSRIA
jgi:hypothetical protein